MKIKDMDNAQLNATMVAMLNEMEDRLITKLVECNKDGVNDDDFYFLNDMLRLTRSYANLVPEIDKIGMNEESA